MQTMTNEQSENEGVLIDEIVYANEEEGTLNAYMCVPGKESAKKIGHKVFTYKMNEF